MMKDIIERYAERIQAWEKAATLIPPESIHPKRNAVELYKALVSTQSQNAALQHDLNGAKGAILNYKGVVEYYETQNATLLEALHTLDRAHKKGFVDLKNFRNIPTKAIREAAGKGA